MVKARETLEGACAGGYAPACFNVGVIHREGFATQKNHTLAQVRFRQSCDLGYQTACQALEQSSSVGK
jgi:TPR repeat protein